MKHDGVGLIDFEILVDKGLGVGGTVKVRGLLDGVEVVIRREMGVESTEVECVEGRDRYYCSQVQMPPTLFTHPLPRF